MCQDDAQFYALNRATIQCKHLRVSLDVWCIRLWAMPNFNIQTFPYIILSHAKAYINDWHLINLLKCYE